jgi:hypothetical protein
MLNLKRTALVVTTLFALSSCGSTARTAQLNRPARAMEPKSAVDVQLFMSRPTDIKFTEVMMIEVAQESAFSTKTKDELLAQLRENAGAQGCDGLIVEESKDTMVVDGDSYDTAGYKGVCIQLNEG